MRLTVAVLQMKKQAWWGNVTGSAHGVWSQALCPVFTQGNSIYLARGPVHKYQKGNEKKKRKGRKERRKRKVGRKKRRKRFLLLNIITEQVPILLVWAWVKKWSSQYRNTRMEFWSTLLLGICLWLGLVPFPRSLSCDPQLRSRSKLCVPHSFTYSACHSLLCSRIKESSGAFRDGWCCTDHLAHSLSLQIWTLRSRMVECWHSDHSCKAGIGMQVFMTISSMLLALCQTQ